MPRREVTVFSISLLDLLSGALGAVILLFLIVPKLDAKKAKALEKLEDIQEEVGKLDSLMSKAKQSVPKNLMNKIQQKIKKIKKQLRQTKKQVEDLKDKLKQCEQVKKKLKKQVKQQKRKVKKLQQKVKQVQQKLEKEKNVGFKIKSKVLFVVDLSGSMQGNKLNEVKAGLKMIVATMNPKHSMDILYFPGQNSNYGTYNNQLKKISRSFKYKTYRFIAGLGIYGGTPTKAAMTHALNNPGYSDVQSIILLTDGEPNGDISNVLSTINQANTRDVAINTIGVGSVFRQEDSNNDAVRFLKDLAKQNDGFYIGF